MKVKSVVCVSCGAPLDISPNSDTVTCTYCGVSLAVEGDRSRLALKTVEEVGRRFQDVGDRTQQAIRDSTYVTQAELRRLQLNQDLSSAQMQLSSTQSEIRSLERQKQNRKIRQQLQELRQQERFTRQRIRDLQVALAPATSEGRDPTGVTTVAGHGPDWRGTLALCALLGWLGAHRFYSGHRFIGLLQLVTLGGFGIWWLIDLAMIISGKYTDSRGRFLEGRNPAMGSGCAWALGVFLVVTVLGSIIVGGLASDSGPVVIFLALAMGGIAFFYFRSRYGRK